MEQLVSSVHKSSRETEINATFRSHWKALHKADERTKGANEVAYKIRMERKEVHIPKVDRERSLYGSEFEIQLRNKLTQRAIAKEYADWMRRKATFKSNRSKAPLQQFACVQSSDTDTAYMPVHGFTAVDLG